VIANPEVSNSAAANAFRISSLHSATMWRAKASETHKEAIRSRP
jgi:hypothetical protein